VYSNSPIVSIATSRSHLVETAIGSCYDIGLRHYPYKISCFAPQHVSAVWQVIANHCKGLRMCEVAEWAGLPHDVVAAIMEDLHVDGCIYWDRRTGRWRVETSPD
jgi:hypothetical protein